MREVEGGERRIRERRGEGGGEGGIVRARRGDEGDERGGRVRERG